MGIKAPADPVYRAAILTARDIESESEPTRTSVGVALAATLERHGVHVKGSDSKNSGKSLGGILELDGAEGVVVTLAGEERPDWNSIARQNRWQRVHLVQFAPRSVNVRTVAV